MTGFKLFIAALMLFGCQSFAHASAKSCAVVHTAIQSQKEAPRDWARRLFNQTKEARKNGENILVSRSDFQSTFDFLKQGLNEAEATFAQSANATELDKNTFAAVKERLAVMSAQDQIDLKAFMLISGHISMLLTRKLSLEGKPIVEKPNYRTPDFEYSFKRILKNPLTIQMRYTYSDYPGQTYLYSLIPREYFENPEALFLPTEKSLGLRDIYELFDIPVFFIGLSKETQTVDGIEMSPIEFFMHDSLHAQTIMTVKVNWREKDAGRKAWLKKRFSQKLASIKDLRLKKVVAAYWFYIFHEPQPTIPFTREGLIKALKETQYADIFLSRTSNMKDMGIIFSKSGPPDKALVDRAIRWPQTEI